MSVTLPLPFDLFDHHALVTGANHGIGAATAEALASCGASVLLAYWSLDDRVNTGAPEAYRQDRAASADDVVDRIRAAGGRATAVESDLTDPHSATRLFDARKQRSDRWTSSSTTLLAGFRTRSNRSEETGWDAPSGPCPRLPSTASSQSMREGQRSSWPNSHSAISAERRLGAESLGSRLAGHSAFPRSCPTARPRRH
jgi:hypothetical protein